MSLKHLEVPEKKKLKREWACPRIGGMPHLNLILFIYFGANTGDSQRLLLALHSKITPYGTHGTMWMLGIKP